MLLNITAPPSQTLGTGPGHQHPPPSVSQINRKLLREKINKIILKLRELCAGQENISNITDISVVTKYCPI